MLDTPTLLRYFNIFRKKKKSFWKTFFKNKYRGLLGLEMGSKAPIGLVGLHNKWVICCANTFI